MSFSTGPRFRKYVKSYGFLSFERKFGDKYGKKSMDTATKTAIDAAKTDDLLLLMTWDCFEHKMWHDCIKMEFKKNVNFLDTTSDDKVLLRFVTKK